MSDHLGRPYVYFAFYSKYDPGRFQKNALFKRDQFFLYNVDGFDKYIFTKNIENTKIDGKNLYLSVPGNLPTNTQSLKKIYNLKNEPIFEIGITKNVEVY